MVTQELLHSLFEYKDGFLIRKTTTSHNAKEGDVIQSVEPRGYVVVLIKGKSYKVHRLVFFMHYGYFPEKIDHIDCNKTNNKIENLRPATHTQNLQNRPKYKNNTSGLKGVSFHRRTSKWQASIRIAGKQKYLGIYERKEDAYLVYCEACKKHHGSFSNVN